MTDSPFVYYLKRAKQKQKNLEYARRNLVYEIEQGIEKDESLTMFIEERVIAEVWGRVATMVRVSKTNAEVMNRILKAAEASFEELNVKSGVTNYRQQYESSVWLGVSRDAQLRLDRFQRVDAY